MKKPYITPHISTSICLQELPLCASLSVVNSTSNGDNALIHSRNDYTEEDEEIMEIIAEEQGTDNQWGDIW